MACSLTAPAKCHRNKPIVVVYENDVHCSVEGYAKFAGFRDAIQKADTAYVLTTSSGDFAQGGTWGAISGGMYPIQLMNAVGYDVVTTGNHEYDYKLDGFHKLMGALNTSVVCDNYYDRKAGKYPFAPYVIKKCGKKKIAFVGVLHPNTMYTEQSSFIENGDTVVSLVYDDVFKHLQKTVDAARKKGGADYVVVLAHLGDEDKPYTSHELIAQTNGIDAVLDGHSHTVEPERFLMNKDGKPVLLTQTGTKFQYVGKLYINGSYIHSELVDYKNITDKSNAVESVYESINQKSKEKLQEVVGHTDFELTINADGKRAVRRQETNLGDLCADALRWAGKAQIGMINGGGVRAVVQAGDITYQNVIDVHPFSNSICVIKATGQQILDALEYTYRKAPAEEGGFLQVSGLKCDFDTTVHNKVFVDEKTNLLSVTGPRRVTNVQVLNDNGKYEPLNLSRVYTVCTSYYVAFEGGETLVLRNSELVMKDAFVDNEALLDYLRLGLNGRVPSMYKSLQNRINIVK